MTDQPKPLRKLAKGCDHPRCGNREWHHADPAGGFSEACEPFKLSSGECECRRPARYGTLPDSLCGICAGTGYTAKSRAGRRDAKRARKETP